LTGVKFEAVPTAARVAVAEVSASLHRSRRCVRYGRRGAHESIVRYGDRTPERHVCGAHQEHFIWRMCFLVSGLSCL
jgi:hypothetical protein